MTERVYFEGGAELLAEEPDPEPIDHAALQKELSEGPGGRMCDDCECMSYDQALHARSKTVTEFFADGWENSTTRAGLIRRCAECKAFNASKPYRWIADIEPAKFVEWMQTHHYAFFLDDLRVLLDKPADDGRGFRML